MMIEILFINIDEERHKKIESSLCTSNCEFEILVATSVEDGILTYFEKKPHIVVAECFDNSAYCFRLANVRNKLNWDSYFLLLTNSSNLAIQAIKSKIDELLVEPFSEKELEKKIIGLLKAPPKNNPITDKNRIQIKTIKGDYLIHIDDIIFCKADGSYSILNLADGKTVTASHNLGKIESYINSNELFRVNRSYLINTSKITYIDKKKKVCGIKYQNEHLCFKISNDQLRKLFKLKIV